MAKMTLFLSMCGRHGTYKKTQDLCGVSNWLGESEEKVANIYR